MSASRKMRFAGDIDFEKYIGRSPIVLVVLDSIADFLGQPLSID